MLRSTIQPNDTDHPPQGKALRLLLVDDNEDEFLLLQDALRETQGHQYDLDWVGNYAEALVQIDEDTHDAYLIDYHLGGKTGLDLIREALGRLRCNKPLIMITGFGSQRLDEAVFSAGGADFISKHDLTPMNLDRVITHAIARTKREIKLRDWALQDTLTGLSNRKHVDQLLPRMIAAARSQKEAMAVLYLDLDGFKVINDTAGHAYGDVALKTVAKRWGKLLRRGDLLARLGGDEFVVLAMLEEQTHTLAQLLAMRLIQALEGPFQLDGKVFKLGVSVGVACYPLHAKSGNALLERADQAMYEAKRMGGNRVVIATKDVSGPEDQH